MPLDLSLLPLDIAVILGLYFELQLNLFELFSVDFFTPFTHSYRSEAGNVPIAELRASQEFRGAAVFVAYKLF